MLRHITRSFREVIERKCRLLREKKQPQECRQLCESYKKSYPICIQKAQDLHIDTTDISHDEKHQEEKLRQRHLYNCPLLGALGWSGAIVLGWYVSQPICWKKFKKVRQDCPYIKKETSYISFFHLVARYAFSQPISYILPRNSSNKASVVQNNDTEVVLDSIGNSGVQYGPLTAQEALDEAANHFEKAQNSILGEIENKLGVHCMESSRPKEAILHFRKASAMNNAPAAFNLALCHELGYGTKINLHKAAKWYRIASERGHATAMYNLGVFYAQGMGGLPVDTTEASRLFESASKLGQIDAVRALKEITSTSGDGNINGNHKNGNMKVHECNNVLLSEEKLAVKEGDKSVATDATEMLLEALGIITKKNSLNKMEHASTEGSVLPEHSMNATIQNSLLPQITPYVPV